MKCVFSFILVFCVLFTGCSLFDPGEFPEVDAETITVVPEGLSRVNGESADYMSAIVSSYTFSAHSLVCFELGYEDAEFKVRCEDEQGNILFSQPEAEPGIYSIPVEQGRYKFVMSYKVSNGFYAIYSD